AIRARSRLSNSFAPVPPPEGVRGGWPPLSGVLLRSLNDSPDRLFPRPLQDYAASVIPGTVKPMLWKTNIWGRAEMGPAKASVAMKPLAGQSRASEARPENPWAACTTARPGNSPPKDSRLKAENDPRMDPTQPVPVVSLERRRSLAPRALPRVKHHNS